MSPGCRPSRLRPKHLSLGRPNTHAFICHQLRAAGLQVFALGPRPQRPDQGRHSSPNPPTAGLQAAGVGPWSPATAPRLGSSFVSEPTYYRPPSRRSWPWVPGPSAPTKVVVRLPTHPLRAAEPKDLALGPWPHRPDRGPRSSPNPRTAGRRAARFRPWSPATSPRTGSSFTSQPIRWWPPSRRSLPFVPGRRASTRTICPMPKANALRKAKAKALRKAKAKALRRAKAKPLRKAEAEALRKAKVKAFRKAKAKALRKAKVKALRKPKTRPGPLVKPSPTGTMTSTRTQQRDSPPVGPIATRMSRRRPWCTLSMSVPPPGSGHGSKVP